MTRLRLATSTHHCELVHKLGIGDHRVNCRTRKILVLRCKLGEEIPVAGMQCPKEEPHLEDKWNSNR